MEKTDPDQALLPERANLENLKKQARTLLRQVRAGGADALKRVRDAHPRPEVTSRFSLSGAQLVLAREHGFASWSKLKAALANAHAPAVTSEGLPLLRLPAGVWCFYSDGFVRAPDQNLLAAAHRALDGDGRVVCVTETAGAPASTLRAGAIASVRIVPRRAGEAAALRVRYLGRAKIVRWSGDEHDQRVEVESVPDGFFSSLERQQAAEQLCERLRDLARASGWISRPELSDLAKSKDLAGVIARAAAQCPEGVRQELFELPSLREVVDRIVQTLEGALARARPEPVGESTHGAPGLRDSEALLAVVHSSDHPHLIGRHFPLADAVTSIGRGAGNEVLLHGDAVSRVHARIDREGTDYVLIDAGSTNGTFVHGEPAPVTRRVLEDGDQIVLGDAILSFLRGGDLGAKFREAIDYVARYDALTRVYNRGTFASELGRQVLHARGSNEPLCALLLEIDELARITAEFGRLAGNAATIFVARRLEGALGSGGVLGHHDDHRFAIVLPRTGLTSALEVAERLRAEIAAKPVEVFGETVSLTVSVGAAPLYGTTGPEELIEDALAALARAGRNRVRGPEESAA